VIVPEREVVELFDCTEKATLPEPLPDAPDVIVIQGTADVAVHEQPVVVGVTVNVPVPPAASTFCDVGLSE
jgi:hypothetical protein